VAGRGCRDHWRQFSSLDGQSLCRGQARFQDAGKPVQQLRSTRISPDPSTARVVRGYKRTDFCTSQIGKYGSGAAAVSSPNNMLDSAAIPRCGITVLKTQFAIKNSGTGPMQRLCSQGI